MNTAVVVLALLGPFLAVLGAALAVAGAFCWCPECVRFWNGGWRVIWVGVALVVAAWFLVPWPEWLSP